MIPSGSKISEREIQQATRHLFLCIGPDCCDEKKGSRVWDVLKSESKKLDVPVLRTKAACVRICKGGPWLVIYPEGAWYGEVDEKRLRCILKEHVEEGRPIREWLATDMPCLGHHEDSQPG